MKPQHIEIDVSKLRAAIHNILDHLTDDLGIEKISVDEDYYWNCPAAELYDVRKPPIGLDIGSLADDVEFTNKVQRGQAGDITYNLVHVVPLLRYIAEKIKS